jgi:hypothetical protein
VVGVPREASAGSQVTAVWLPKRVLKGVQLPALLSFQPRGW